MQNKNYLMPVNNCLRSLYDILFAKSFNELNIRYHWHPKSTKSTHSKKAMSQPSKDTWKTLPKQLTALES